VNVPDTMDAMDWVKEWAATLEKNPNIPSDDGAMLAWFASAIMAGYSAGYRHRAEVEEQGRS
jgi:hypothetical protein